MIRLLPLLLLGACSSTYVQDGDFMFRHRGNVGIITQTLDNGAGTIALGTGSGNGVQVARQVLEMEAGQPGSITVRTPSGGLVVINGPVSYGATDEAASSAANRALRTIAIDRAIKTVTGGVVDIAIEAIEQAD